MIGEIIVGLIFTGTAGAFVYGGIKQKLRGAKALWLFGSYGLFMLGGLCVTLDGLIGNESGILHILTIELGSGGVLMLMGGMLVMKIRRKLICRIKVEAKVTSVHEQRGRRGYTTYAPHFYYRYKERKYYAAGEWGGRRIKLFYKKNKKVTIFINEKDPKVFYYRGITNVWEYLIVCFCVVIMIMGARLI